MRRFLILLIFVFFFCITAEVEARKLALLIGVDEYENIHSLHCCVNDVKTLKAALLKVGFEENDIQTLVTGSSLRDLPTKKKIEKKLSTFLASVGPDDLVFLSFSGHGAQDGEKVYFCPPEIELADLDGTCISITKVMEDLAACNAKFKWMVVDACRNDPNVNTRAIGSKGLQSIPTPPAGIVLFQSCTAGEVSLEDFKSGNGFFTKNFAAALSGEADIDLDGELTLMEVCSWTISKTREQVMKAEKKSQRPYYSGNVPNFIITRDLNIPKAKALAAEAEKAMGEEMYELAIEKFNEALALCPKFEQWKREREYARKFLDFANPHLKAEEFYQLGEKWATADHGKGEQDWNLATDYYRQAAELGHARAMAALGNCYYFGRGIGKDLQKMLMWYRKAADLKEPMAYNNLGFCYELGNGVSKDEQEARRWYGKCFQACYAQKDLGDPIVQNLLGVCYEHGYGTGKNQKEAVRWYRMAAEQGHAGAQCSLGFCYRNGTGVTKNEKEAVHWYRMAAEQGSARAQNNLGACYFNGTGVKKNIAEAKKWFLKAADQGDTQAIQTLKGI